MKGVKRRIVKIHICENFDEYYKIQEEKDWQIISMNVLAVEKKVALTYFEAKEGFVETVQAFTHVKNILLQNKQMDLGGRVDQFLQAVINKSN